MKNYSIKTIGYWVTLLRQLVLSRNETAEKKRNTIVSVENDLLNWHRSHLSFVSFTIWLSSGLQVHIPRISSIRKI